MQGAYAGLFRLLYVVGGGMGGGGALIEQNPLVLPNIAKETVLL